MFCPSQRVSPSSRATSLSRILTSVDFPAEYVGICAAHPDRPYLYDYLLWRHFRVRNFSSRHSSNIFEDRSLHVSNVLAQ